MVLSSTVCRFTALSGRLASFLQNSAVDKIIIQIR